MKANASFLLGSCFLALAACTSSSETANADTLTAHVGIYDPPPSGLQRVRVGVPPFKVEDKVTGDMPKQAADQLITLGQNTNRFNMIERTKLDELLKEQSLEGIVRSSELAQPAQVRGVDYLLLGKITNFKVKAEKTSKGFNLGNLPIPGTHGALGLFDIKDKNSRIQVDVGVDLRLVDPTTGETMAAQFAEYTEADSLGAMGVSILGANAQADAQLEVDADSQGKILRLALDHCVRRMLPSIDNALLERARANPAAAQPAMQPALQPAETTPTGAAKFCSGCGQPLKAEQKFCAGCGKAVGG